MSKDDPARTERLATALRANLRRRKAQAREQARPPESGDPRGEDEPPER